DELGEAGDRALATGVMNIGVRPTIGGAPALRIEAHLFDLDADLYDKRLRANLVARIRDERKFPGLDALKAQIALDAAAARAALGSASGADGDARRDLRRARPQGARDRDVEARPRA